MRDPISHLDAPELSDDLASELLGWYDRHARDMPWRVPPGSTARADPYRIWLSEVMLQQTTVAAVKAYFVKFVTLWPSVSDLAKAEDADVMAAWAGLGYYARARNLLKCARVVTAEHGGAFPADPDLLLTLPGVGPYTAAAISAIAFDLPQTVLDGNVERVMARLHNDATPLPAAKPVFMAYAQALTCAARPGDYAQAVMDLGATICTPRKPACGLCPWRPSCRAWAEGTQADLPQKTPKKRKPTRHGIAYLARRVDGAWLLERRPDKGLLGGMLGWPGSDWLATDGAAPQDDPPIRAEWKDAGAQARHTFTHFHLHLDLRTALVPMDRAPERGGFVPPDAFDRNALPTLMRKAFDLVQGP